MKKASLIFILIFITVPVSPQQTLKVGDTISNVELSDSDGNPKSLPFIGEKVTIVYYTDPDVKDVNTPMSDAVREKKFSKDNFASIGVVNCEDTWMPNSAIKAGVRNREKKFPNSTILIDEEYILAKKWRLGECNDAVVVIIISRDSKIKLIKTIKSEEGSQAAIQNVLKILEEEITE